MKKLLTALLIGGFLFACSSGGGKEEQNTENELIDTEEESVIVNQLSEDLESDKQEIQKATEENLQEVDSLLENFEQ